MTFKVRFLLWFVISILIFACVLGTLDYGSKPALAAGLSYSVLHNFKYNDGEYPAGSLTASGTTLYGMTPSGGANMVGTIFAFDTKKGNLNVLHNFSDASGSDDGWSAHGSLTVSGSTLYGMTMNGGTNDNGTIFKLDTQKNSYKVLYSFLTGVTNTSGDSPYGDLTLSGATLYGMTEAGGSSDQGEIFKYDISGGSFTPLHSFAGNDGCAPFGDLTMLGTTLYGMTGGCWSGEKIPSSIFSYNMTGNSFKVLHTFSGGADDGDAPRGSFIAKGTTLYGLTDAGGAHGSGTIFSYDTKSNSVKVLHSFAGLPNDGGAPVGSLTQVGAALYGMTSYGGAGVCETNHVNYGCGTIFKYDTKDGSYELLHSFTGGTNDGANPTGSLTAIGTTLYGMTSGGGSQGLGTIFSIVKGQPPGTPTGITAKAGNAQATVTFTPPTTNGGSPITGYTVISNPAGGVDTDAGTTSTTHVVTGLTNGKPYTFTVTATNSAGTGAASSPSNKVTPQAGPTVPGVPKIVTVTPGNGQATVSFTLPSNGGSPITSFTVISSPEAKKGTGVGSPISVKGLTNGTAYTFTVRATNKIGTGPASSPSSPVTPATIPGAPLNVTAKSGNAQATVSFNAPASNGGSPITSYTVTCSPGGKIASGKVSPITVNGLSNGTSYTFTVKATNKVGTGPASSPSNSVTPTAPSSGFSGTWNGSWNSDYGSSGSVSATIVQSGSTLSGKLSVYGTACSSHPNFTNLTLSGQVSGNEATLQASCTCSGVKETLYYTNGIISGNEIDGVYTVTAADNSYFDSGSFSLSK